VDKTKIKPKITCQKLKTIVKKMNKLIQNIQLTLAELNAVVGQLEEQQFIEKLPIFSGSSIGMHARHIVEFYQCLMEQTIDNQCINYDNRSRDLLLQTNLDYFAQAVETVISTLDTMSDKQLQHPLSIATEESTQLMKSSFDRELQYNLEHTIHHAALIKIGILNMLPDSVLPPSFGVAPSTISYQKQKNNAN
jgi:uncharacterized damage-inducible protein DinB